MSKCTYFHPIDPRSDKQISPKWVSLGMDVCVRRAPHQPQAISSNISLAFKARLLCKQKALQPPPEQVALCAEVADALADCLNASLSARQGQNKHVCEHCHADLQPRDARTRHSPWHGILRARRGAVGRKTEFVMVAVS